MSSPITNQVSVTKDVEKNIPQDSQTSSWNGRTVTKVPTSHDEYKLKRTMAVGGVGSCCIAVVCIIAGGMMWGVCDDPTIDGCNEAVKKAGQGLVGVGCGIIGLVTCCMFTMWLVE